MDSKASLVPETVTSISDNSGSSPNSNSFSTDSVLESSKLVDNNLNHEIKGSGGGGHGSVEDEDEDEEEVFETAPEILPIESSGEFSDGEESLAKEVKLGELEGVDKVQSVTLGGSVGLGEEKEGVVGEDPGVKLASGEDAVSVSEVVEKSGIGTGDGVDAEGLSLENGVEKISGEVVGLSGEFTRKHVDLTASEEEVPGVESNGGVIHGSRQKIVYNLETGAAVVDVDDKDSDVKNNHEIGVRSAESSVEGFLDIVNNRESEKKPVDLTGSKEEVGGVESNGQGIDGSRETIVSNLKTVAAVVDVDDKDSAVKIDREIGIGSAESGAVGFSEVVNNKENVESETEKEAGVATKDGDALVKASNGGLDVSSISLVDADGRDKDNLARSNSNDTGALIVNEAQDNEKYPLVGGGEIEGMDAGETEGLILESSAAAKRFLEELVQGVSSRSIAESSHDHSQRIDGQVATDSDEEVVDTDEEGEGKEMFDAAALAALLKAATGGSSDGGSITVSSQDGSRLFSVERPAGLGSSLRSLKPASRPNRPTLFASSHGNDEGDSDTNLSEEERQKLEKLQQLRVKFLRLVHRLGHSPEENTAAQVLYRLSLVAGRQTNNLFNLDAAKRTASELEEEGKDDLDFSLNILVLGKTGVGKSATINSILGEQKSQIHAFLPSTTCVREISGNVDGVKITVIDSPGLKASGSEQGMNRKVLSSIKKFTRRCPPDIVLYVDRLDTQTRDLNDLPLLRTITSTLGSSIWRNAIVTLTHSASAPPDGPSGSPLSYEVFVAQRSHVVQQSIGQAVGDLRLMNPSLMNAVSLVENHPSCRKNRDGHKVLPNGQAWRSQLLLLCYSVKILSEASSLSKSQDPFDHKKLFGFRVRSPPLPYLLSWLLQSRTHPKLSTDQGADSVDSDVDLADFSDTEEEDEDDEYDQLPPFKPLRRSQLAKLSQEQRKAYFEEYDYRVKLLQKKQWREELRRMREIKKKGKVAGDDVGYIGEDADVDGGAPTSVPVPLPDMVLPPSFDGDNPAYRYRFLEPTSQFLARPVLDTHGWDHDCGYDGVNIEQSLAVVNRFPAAVTVQVTKDKKEFNIHLDSSISAKHGENGSSMAGFDIQNVGKQLAYVVRGETKFKNLKKNKTAAGVSVTFLGKNVATGFKVEDQINLGKRLTLVGSTGTVRSQGDSAYGANLEMRLRDADFPIGQDQSSLGLSLVKWRGDLALGANLQSQFSIGRSSKIAVRAGLNNKMSGQLSVRTSSSEQLQIALVGLLPIATSIYKIFRSAGGESYSMY